MDDRRSMRQNLGIWDQIGPLEETTIKKLYVNKQTGGLRAVRIVGTYIGIIAVLARLQFGIKEGLIAAGVVAVLNILVLWYTKWSALTFNRNSLYAARGTCVKTEVKTEQSHDDNSTRSFTHYYATFKMKDGAEYSINLAEPYFRKLSQNDTFIFVRASGRGAFSYFSQREVNWLMESSGRDLEEIDSDWLSTENWQQAEGKFRNKLLTDCRVTAKPVLPWLFGGIVCIAFTALIAWNVWPYDNIKSVTGILVILMTFGLVGASLIWSSLHSYWVNARITAAPVYYCRGKCTKLDRASYIELENGQRFVLPPSDKNKADAGNIRCVNTRLAYQYKNKFIGKAKKFDPDWYEKQLFIVR